LAGFLEEDCQEQMGWKAQVAQKMASKPGIFHTNQRKLSWAVGQLENVALAQIMPYSD
jgi:hypothetical protein